MNPRQYRRCAHLSGFPAIAILLLLGHSAWAKEFTFPNFDGFYNGVAAGYGVDPNAADPNEMRKSLGITFGIAAGPINSGNFSYTAQLVHDSSDVFNSRSASAEVEGRYLMFSGKASFEVGVASRKTTDSIMWTVTAEKDYGIREQLTGIKLNEVALARWKTDGYDAFVKQYGTRFISAWSRKAHLSVIFEAYNITQEDQGHVDAMIEASAQYAAGSVEAKAKMSSAFHNLSSNARTRVTAHADGFAVDKYFAGATDLTALDQIQAGVIALLGDIEKQQGNVAEYITTAYADVIVGFPLLPPFPEFPELKKAQDAFEQAYVVKLKIEAFKNGPRGPYLDAKELGYLGAKTAECDARLAQISQWLKQFKLDTTLVAREWPDIALKLPELIFYAAMPYFATGPRGLAATVCPVFVGGGNEVGAIHWDIQTDPSNARHGEQIASRDAGWPSPYSIQSLDEAETLDQKRGFNGSLQRWYQYFDQWIPAADFANWKTVHHAWLVDKAGNTISYAKDREGRYVVPEVKVGLAAEPWPGPDGDLTYKMLESGDYGSVQYITKPIDSAVFQSGQEIQIEAWWHASSTRAQVFILLDKAKVSDSPLSPEADSQPAELRYRYTLQNVGLGDHTLDMIPAGGEGVGVKLAPVRFKVVAAPLAPAITLQPKSAILSPGSPISLSADASGSGPMVYTWLKNGKELFDNERVSGSGSSELTISPATYADLGIYSVVARNEAGTATSASASLSTSGGGPTPQITSPALYFGFGVSGEIGKTYRIEYVENAGAQNWTPAGTVSLVTTPQLWLDTTASASRKRFYRTVLLP